MTTSSSSGIGADAGPTLRGFDLAEVIHAASLTNGDIFYMLFYCCTGSI